MATVIGKVETQHENMIVSFYYFFEKAIITL